MKKIIFSVLTVLFSLSVVNVMAYNAGRKGLTNSPGEGNCTQCHSDFSANSGPGSISVSSNIPNWTYTAGQTYTITITVAQTGQIIFGWDLEALKADGSSGGKMMVTDASRSQIGYQTVSSKARANFYQKTNGGLSADFTTISFSWLAPTADSGNVTLYFAGVAGDEDGSESGDYVYYSSLVINHPVASIPLVLTCASNQNEVACQSQTAINNAYNTWLGTTTMSGGCGAVLSNNSSGAPLACGGSTTVMWTATSTCGATQTCSATFTVASASSVVLTAASDHNELACQTQAAIDAAYALWLNSVSVSDGCNTSLTNNSTGAPLACGGSTTVIWTASSDCETPQTTTATFTVSATTPMSLVCPGDEIQASGQTQVDIDAAFNTWLNSATVSGGCIPLISNDGGAAPSAFGGSVTVTWTASSYCLSNATCSAIFTVGAPPALVLTCATDNSVASCQSQTDVNTAFATWLTTASISGGCNANLVNDATTAPAACGGSVIVTWTATSDCDPNQTCSATFTVNAAPTLHLLCPGDQNPGSCLSQTDVDNAFNTWLGSAILYGGCNASQSNDGTTAPNAYAGGSVIVTWTAISDCEAPVTCSATFTVTGTTAVSIDGPLNHTESECKTQTQIDNAYNFWLNYATADGGCGTFLTNNSTGAPSACGGSVTVTWTATSNFEAPVTYSATFDVNASPTVAITCAVNHNELYGQTQLDIDAAFNTWLATATVSGGCNAVLTNDATVAPSATGGSVTVTWTATSDCQTNVTCSATFTVAGPPPTISTSVTVLNGFSAPVNGYSAKQFFEFSGNNITDSLKVAAPAEYEVSLTNKKGSWKKAVYVHPDANNQVALTKVWVRFHPYAQGDARSYIRIKQGTVYLVPQVRVIGNAYVLRDEIALAENDIQVSLSPNPTVATLNIAISNTDKNITVTVFDLAGNKLQSLENVAPGTLLMDVSNLPQGLYFCRIESSNNVIVKKFVKQ